MLTNGALLMSEETTLKAIPNATSLPVSAAGVMPCDSQDGQTNALSGLDHAPVSRLRALGKDRATPMIGTSGPLFTASSPSANLQSSLENRLQARMVVNGSPLSVLTWKKQDMPSGLPICRLQASVPRTSGKDTSLLPTPAADSSGKRLRGGTHATEKWDRLLPTVSAQMQQGGIRMGGGSGATKKWKKVGLLPTVTKRDERMDKWSPAYERRKYPSIDALSSKNGRAGMVDLAALAGWMMGYPRVWLNQLWEASAMPSSRKSRKRS
jgi:hypothetical protein